MTRTALLTLALGVSAVPLPRGESEASPDREEYRRELSVAPFDQDEYEGYIPCNNTVLGSCGEHGTCGKHKVGSADYVCDCDNSWATPSDFNSSGTATSDDICSKERPSRTTAILLSVFTGGVGGGAFYLGWSAYGGICIMLCCFACICAGVGKAKLKESEKGGEDSGKCFWAIVSCLGAFSSCALTGIVITCIVWQAGSKCVDKDGIKCH